MKNWLEREAKLLLGIMIEDPEVIILTFVAADPPICASAAATH
jgi:hypothetical protein